MTGELQTKMLAVEQKLTALIRDGNLGVRDFWFGSIDKSAPNYPVVHCLMTGNVQNEYQVQQPGKIGWDLEYEVTCIFAGTDDRTTIKNLQKFTNSIYDVLQGQQESGKRLDGEIQNINCPTTDYVTFERPTKTFVYGAVITMIIQVFETR